MGKIPLTFCYQLPLEGCGYTKCGTLNCQSGHFINRD